MQKSIQQNPTHFPVKNTPKSGTKKENSQPDKEHLQESTAHIILNGDRLILSL